MTGGKTELPEWPDVRERLLADLHAEPVPVSVRERRLRAVLGVA